MRYIINTKDEEGIIGMQIAKWVKDGKVELIEKAEPVVEIKVQLERVSKALEIMKKSGYNSEVMKIYLNKKTGVSMGNIEAVMRSQEDFFKAIGVR